MDDGHEGSLKIYQDAILSRIDLDKGHSFEYQLKSEHHGVYVMIIDGETIIGNDTLQSRDAMGVSEIASFTINASETSEILLIEVPMNI